LSVATLSPDLRQKLQDLYGSALQFDVPLARYTTARIGGPAEALITARSADELAHASRGLWDLGLGFIVLGGGSNVLVSDHGVKGVVILNRARETSFREQDEGLFALAESGAVLGTVSRLAAERGWTGLEWAATVPGTVGGAVVGNAGAHGGDMSESISVAEILQHSGQIESWSLARLDFGYRTSALKRTEDQFIVLTATFIFEQSTPEECKQKMRAFSKQRESSQPAGASIGSMFKNPPDDYAGRLIESAGLKGFRSGGVKISEKHANFFINEGDGSAADVYALITRAREAVDEQFGVQLELEIELIGDWARDQEKIHSGDGAVQ
jgi:UDP-N-acetylmuramate dehydrogenase